MCAYQRTDGPPTRTPQSTNLRPLSPVEEQDLIALTAIVPEGELRDALERLGQAAQAAK